MKPIQHLKYVCLGAGAICAVACGEEPSAAKAKSPKPVAAAALQPVAPAGSNLAAQAATAPAQVSAPTEYTYDFSVRDPFRPMLQEPAPDETIDSCGPLCNYDVTQFRLSGIIWGISQPAAMVRSPDGKPYVIKVGTPIGRNKGKVVSIAKDRIAILEKYVNYRGEVVTNRVDIELPVEGGTRK